MDFLLIGFVYAVVLIIAANHEAKPGESRPLTALLSMGLTSIRGLWTAFAALVAWFNPVDQPKFNSRDPVHRAAGLLFLAQLSVALVVSLRAFGGATEMLFPSDLEGLVSQSAVGLAVGVSLAALGTGLGTRRGWRAVAQRLGLGNLAVRDCVMGAISGAALFVGISLAVHVILSSGMAQAFGDRLNGSRPYFDVLSQSLPATLLVSIMVGIGEEILFRGAFQPVFGIVLSSALFALMHAQYAFSPALLLIFFVSLGFGWLRLRYSTFAAIIAHATYNLLPFLIIVKFPV